MVFAKTAMANVIISDMYINAFARDCSFERFEHIFVLSATLKSQRLSSSINQWIDQFLLLLLRQYFIRVPNSQIVIFSGALN